MGRLRANRFENIFFGTSAVGNVRTLQLDSARPSPETQMKHHFSRRMRVLDAALPGVIMSRKSTRMYNSNRFKLGLFAPNCSGGLTMTKAPERWEASWDNNVKAAQLSDEAGLEFILPVGRWHGYRGETDTEGTSFETLTWAS